MRHIQITDAEELDALFQKARLERASASLRVVGSFRLLGDLQVCGYEGRTAIHLSGAKLRDQLPARGTSVTVSILLGDEIVSMQCCLLDALQAEEGETYFPPVLRVGWPLADLEVHRRDDIRCGTPETKPLKVVMDYKDRRFDAKLFSLTETGMGIGIYEKIHMDLHSQVEVRTELPGGLCIQSTGSVRHLEWLDEDPAPTRLGLVLGCMTEQARESLRRFIQARRTDRSDKLRTGEA